MTNPYIFDCSSCESKCDGVSKGTYIFKNDTAFSSKFEEELIDLINSNTNKIARKTQEAGYPDIGVYDENNTLLCYIELKAQQRTFMAVENILPQGNLKPSETIALNLSDLVRYFDIFDKTKVITFLVWVLSNRPCVLKGNQKLIFFQDMVTLKKTFDVYEMKRRFRRQSGVGDVVDGKHKGVVVNYHFSLNELRNGIEALLNTIKLLPN